MSTLQSSKTPYKGTLLNKVFNARTLPMLVTIFVCIALYGGAILKWEAFSSPSVFFNLLVIGAPIGIVAVGMTMVIISGGIDLSVGGVVALCTVVIAKLIMFNGWNPLAAFGAALCIGSGMGFLTGCAVRYFKIEPFIATLAGLFLARGAAYVISEEKPVNINNGLLTALSDRGVEVGSLYMSLTDLIPALTLLLIVALGLYVTQYTPFGRNLFAIGGNEDAAHLMGLPVGKTKIMVYVLSGFLAALAAVVYTIFLPCGDPTAANGWELNAIAAAVIGGTLMTGGAGNIFGTLIGVIILGIIQSSLDFQNLSSYYAKIFTGGMLFVFVVLQRFLGAKAYRKN